MNDIFQKHLVVRSGAADLNGTLSVPPQPFGVILFAHGSGSGRKSPRNRKVARFFEGAGFATLLMDLLSCAEEEQDRITGEFRFDIPLLSERLKSAIHWLESESECRTLALGLYGSSTGAAAALTAAADVGERVSAVVSRGGRPDLAGAALRRVVSPTLFIVGELDYPVINLNREARKELRGISSIEIVPGATHLFEEPGTLDLVAHLARDWFQKFLVQHPATFA